MAIVRKLRPGLGDTMSDLLNMYGPDTVTLPAEQPSGTPEVSIYGLPSGITTDTTGAFWPAEPPPITPILPGITPGTVLTPYTPQSDAGVYTPAPSFWDSLFKTATNVATQLIAKPKAAAAPIAARPAALPAGYRPVATAGVGGVSPWLLAAGVVGIYLATQKRGRRR